MKRARSASNSGIQANNVTADVMAVGAGSTATKVVHSGATDADLVAFLRELRGSIAQLPLQQPAKEELADDMVKLETATRAKETRPEQVSGILSSIVGKLKMVGVVLADAAAIAEPIKKIAGLFGLPFAW